MVSGCVFLQPCVEAVEHNVEVVSHARTLRVTGVVRPCPRPRGAVAFCSARRRVRKRFATACRLRGIRQIRPCPAHAREEGTAGSRLLVGAVSFCPRGRPSENGRRVWRGPARITGRPNRCSTCGSSPKVRCPDARMAAVGEAAHLVNVVTGSAAILAPWRRGSAVREGGPVRLWKRVERVLDDCDAAGAPGPETFTLHVYDGGQHLRDPHLPGLPLPQALRSPQAACTGPWWSGNLRGLARGTQGVRFVRWVIVRTRSVDGARGLPPL